MLTGADVQKAIEYIEESRETHVAWINWIRDYPLEAAKPKPQIEVAGNIPFHEKCVSQYDHVLKVLRAVAQSPTLEVKNEE